MGRRSDHSRDELEELILATGQAVMGEGGFARFSGREVAKRIGYSIGTIHNVCGNHDRLVTAINTRTFGLWAQYLRDRLAHAGEDRIAALVEGYFGFARDNTNLWAAIYEHRPAQAELSESDHQRRGELTAIVVEEVARALNRQPDDQTAALARSLIATVHGHCSFALTGAWATMGGEAPERDALSRVREALSAQEGR
jgi:AcrR family transcriptional regulator